MPEEFKALPKELAEGITAYLVGPDYDDEKPCLWLDLETRRCRHYEHRPEVCREYRLGGYYCQAERVRVGLSVEGWPVVFEED